MRRDIYWIPFKTIVIKEFLRFIRIWPQTVLPPAITMTLYFVIFGQLIGERIGKMDGFDYVDFFLRNDIAVYEQFVCTFSGAESDNRFVLDYQNGVVYFIEVPFFA